MTRHKSVLLGEVIKFLEPGEGKSFIDATVGYGGHSLEILRRGARVLGIDRDPEAIEYLEKQVENTKYLEERKLILVNENFSKIEEIARREGFSKVNGILFDLGVSSPQLENASRGLSFSKEGPLDMRMDPTLGIRAHDIVNNFEERRLSEVLEAYGQEKLSRSIAGAICSARQIRPIETTCQLSAVVTEVYAKKRQNTKLHPATKTFQALRIVVNSELLNLEEALPQTVDLLENKGRLVIISFHSLEDGIVKRFFKREKKLKVVTKKPVGPSEEELVENPRSRSAKLRVAEKVN